MTNSRVRDAAPLDLEGGLAELRGDCAGMVAHWARPAPAVPLAVSLSRIRPIVVPPGSARLLEAMSDYGD